MKIDVNLPFDRIEAGEEFLSPDAVVEIAQTAERLGFHAVCDTDHPVPTGRWLDGSGHYAQDPFVLLSFVAAATTRLCVQTGIIVLPYRNPFITARAVATLDVFSRGRMILGAGAGYLKGEYKALGVDFARRNELTDEYLRAMKTAWTSDEFTFSGSGYQAVGNRILPRPVQRPHPPLLVGGNSKRAIRRAVELGDAWHPFFTAPAVAMTARTAELTDEVGLREGIAHMRAHCEAVGRASPPQLVLSGINQLGEAWNADAILERIATFEALGAAAVALNIDARSRAEWIDGVERAAAEVLRPLGVQQAA